MQRRTTGLFPECTSTSQIARYWYCAEECRINVVEGIRYLPPKAIAGGSRGHAWLEQRPKSKSWLNVYNKLKKLAEKSSLVWFDKNGLGFAGCRYYKGTKIISHPDDYYVWWKTRQIEMVENKTVTNLNWKKYLGPIALQQLSLGCFIWNPIWLKIGFDLFDEHTIQYWHRNTMRYLGEKKIIYNSYEVTDFLDKLWRLFRGEEDPIPPMDFKCERCGVREYCTII